MKIKTTSITGVASKVVPVSSYEHGYRVTVEVSGTVTYTVNWTNRNVLAGETAFWTAETEQSGKSTSTNLHYEGGISAFQLDVTAGTGTATMTISSYTGGVG